MSKLGISSSTEYYKRHKEDPRLPSSPHEYYKGKGWINWPNYFGRETPDLYPTYEEAKQAVKKIGISSPSEYQKRYKEDPRLPSAPNNTYKGKGWINWPNYFGRETPYKTYKEAKLAVRKLGISSGEYGKRHKEDPRLPSRPDKYYEDKGWIDWYDFFGRETPGFYPTYEEAKQAVSKLGISSSTEYYKRHKEDPRLPSAPNNTYKGKGWINWPNYFGRETPYKTYKEAKLAVRKLGISSGEYGKRHKEDPRLPSRPDKYYEDKGWIDWYDFFGKNKKVNK